MTTAYDAPHDEIDEPASRLTKIALGLLVAAMAAMWIWIYLFAPRDNPDRLATRSFAEEAEAICAPLQAEIDALPLATTETTPAERARQVETGTDLTRTMVAELRVAAAAVTDPDDRQLIDAWFADWDAYVDDRQRFIDRLDAAGPDTDRNELRFTLTERASGGIYTRTIDGFAAVNDMESCQTPRDI